MKRDLFIPAVIALGLHGLLLLAQPDEPTPAPEPEDAVAVRELPLMVAPVPEPEPIVDASVPGDQKRPETAVDLPPQLPDVVARTERVDGIHIEIARTTPTLRTERGLIVPASFKSAVGSPDGTGLGDIIGFSGLDNEPRAVVRVPPQYPYEARRAGRGGQVLVSFVVDREGAVRQAHVVGSDAPEFEEPALRAVSRWRFEPGRKDGRTVAFRMTLPVVFSISAEL